MGSATTIRSGKKRDLKVYSAALGGYVSYYRDRHGLEADCVLHLADGRYGLIEFKLGSKGIEEGAAHLLELKELIKKANEKKRAKLREPSFLMVLTAGEMVIVVMMGCILRRLGAESKSRECG